MLCGEKLLAALGLSTKERDGKQIQILFFVELPLQIPFVVSRDTELV